jgi:hypothetical protein
MGQAWICGSNGLRRTLVVALPGGRGRQGGCAPAGVRGRGRARPASRTVGQSGLASTKTVVLLTVEEVDAATKKSVTYRGPGR